MEKSKWWAARGSDDDDMGSSGLNWNVEIPADTLLYGLYWTVYLLYRRRTWIGTADWNCVLWLFWTVSGSARCNLSVWERTLSVLELRTVRVSNLSAEKTFWCHDQTLKVHILQPRPDDNAWTPLHHQMMSRRGISRLWAAVWVSFSSNLAQR